MSGDASAREVEEFIVHPNRFKSELGVGEAIMVIPHDDGSKAISIKFHKFDDRSAKPLEKVLKLTAKGLTHPPVKPPSMKMGEKAEAT